MDAPQLNHHLVGFLGVPLPRQYYVVVLGLVALLLASCDGDGSTEPKSADRDKFVGTWAGSYGCPGNAPVPDTLVVSLGGGALDFSIIIHMGFLNPDTVSGDLTEPNLISVPQQSMGGAPGTARITSHGALLAYSQTGFGITCGGTDYSLVP
jgi:hypothetical protein